MFPVFSRMTRETLRRSTRTALIAGVWTIGAAAYSIDAGAAKDDYGIETISTHADRVSGGDELVA